MILLVEVSAQSETVPVWESDGWRHKGFALKLSTRSAEHEHVDPLPNSSQELTKMSSAVI